MMQDVRQYFKNHPADSPWLAERTGTQLARSGLRDMDTLCAMLEQEPKKVEQIRNIGPKSLMIIQNACEAYRRERGGVR